MSSRHFHHIDQLRGGLHVPYLGAGCDSAADRSPAAALYVDEAGRLLARRNPLQPRDFMVCISYSNRPTWISSEHLAHRHCDHCLDIWQERGHQHHAITGTDHATLFALTELPTTSGHGDTVLLHATELPNSWLTEEAV